MPAWPFRPLTIAALAFAVVGFLVLQFTVNNPAPLQLGVATLAVIPLLLAYVKSVEESCMIRPMKIEDLTEGEWINEDVKVESKLICGPKDLGVTKEQIVQLRDLQGKGKIDSVIVKIGIPFVPAFLIAFLYSFL